MFGIRFIKIQPTTYLLQYRRGAIVREGVGLAFFYYAPSTSLVAIPVGSTDEPFIFEEPTADYQTVTLQGQVSYRVADAKKLAGLMNFTLAPNGRDYLADDPEKLPQRVINLVHVLARAELQKLPLRDAIRSAANIVREVKKQLAESGEIASLGLEVLGFSLLAIKPTPETARALEAQTREQLLKEADEAIYARRNAAVEQERAIKENELNTEIAVENKKRQIRETQMDAEQAVQEKRHQLERADLAARTGLEGKRKELVALAAANAKTEADTRAYGISTTMQALSTTDARILQVLANSGMKPEQLIALAFQELAGLGRVQIVQRALLPNFVFGPEDTVIALGQDGLVANTLKYLNGQPLVGVNPDPQRWDGQLLPFKVRDLDKIVREVLRRRRPAKTVTMAKVTLNTGSTLHAVNDFFIGARTHISARYRIELGKLAEDHSSSGVVVSTGLGSTGWLKSLLTGAAAITQSASSVLASPLTKDEFARTSTGPANGPNPRPSVKTEFAWDADYLLFTVREPFPTKKTGASLVFGRVTARQPLIIESRMGEQGVIFSDGIEQDFLEFNSGTRATIGIAERKGILIT